MELFFTIDQVFSSFFMFLIGLFIIIYLAKRLQINIKLVSCLYIWHTLLCFVSIIYINKYGGDATFYYSNGIHVEPSLSIGTFFIHSIVSILFNLLNLSYLGVTLFFNIIGTMGLLFLYRSLKFLINSKKQHYLVVLLVFLPSISFWSSAIGKDAIAFFAITLSLWASIDYEKKIKTMILSICLMFLVRPHMALIMIVALVFSYMFSKKIKVTYRISIFILSIVSLSVLTPYVFTLVGFKYDGNILSKMIEYIEYRQLLNATASSSINLVEMSFIEQIFTYMFRPLPFEHLSIASLAVSLDNVILLFVFILFLINIFKKKDSNTQNINMAYLYIYSAIALILLAVTTANLGITVRQKWMVMPIIVFIWFTYIAANRKKVAS